MNMKRILVVEDDGMVYKMIEKELDSLSYEIVRARSVAEAIGTVEEEDLFDCFVVDLSILALGLNLEEMDKFKRREGYAFLKNYLWKGNEDEIRDLKRKSIICSRYVNDFRKEYGDETDGLQMVLKDRGFETKVASLIEKICR